MRICVYRHIYTVEPTGAPHNSPRRCGRPVGARELNTGVPQRQQAPPSCAAGPQVTAGGAGAPRDLWPGLLCRLPWPRAFPAFPGRHRAWTLELEESSLIALRIVDWGGGFAFRNFSRLSLSVSAFWCLQNLQRFAYFDSLGVGAVLGSTRR